MGILMSCLPFCSSCIISETQSVLRKCALYFLHGGVAEIPNVQSIRSEAVKTFLSCVLALCFVRKGKLVRELLLDNL